MSKAQFKKTVLKNGIRILTESHKSTRCVVVGFWLERGTRDEAADCVGVSHLIEHLVFKGTKKFSALQIAQKIEAVGGEINAFTAKEHTCFHATTLKEDLELSIQILSQLFNEAIFDAAEFEKEKNVVLQELYMSRDDIEDSVFDEYFAKAFPNDSIGWPILGTEESLKNITVQDVIQWYKKNYLAGNLIVSVAGNVGHDKVVQLVEKYLGKMPAAKKEIVRSSKGLQALSDAKKRESEQVHIVLGTPSLPYGSPRRFEAYMVNACLGGGMTSRLYQKIREDKGWAYSIFSMLNTYTDFGLQIFYAATDKKLYQKLVEELLKEIRLFHSEKIKQKELDFYRRQVKGQLLIASEDVESRMMSLATNEMVFGKYRSVDSVIAEMESVKLKQVNNYIDEFLDLKTMSLYLMGAVNENKDRQWMEGL
ncbi:insulinase family protein [bacterium]|nr:insulinase family protein [bacterium]